MTIIQTDEDSRVVVEVDSHYVSLSRERKSRLRGGVWVVDPDAGIVIDRKHLPELLAALNESEEGGC